jgi:hypothetical protein
MMEDSQLYMTAPVIMPGVAPDPFDGRLSQRFATVAGQSVFVSRRVSWGALLFCVLRLQEADYQETRLLDSTLLSETSASRR